MPKKRSKNKGYLGDSKTFEIHFFVPGSGFRAAFYPAESKVEALQLFKREYPAGRAFWIAPTRGRALGSPVPVKYRVWWKDYGGDWRPHFVFLFDEAENLIGSVPDVGDFMAQQSWQFALNRVGNPKHKLEEVDKLTASMLANEIQGASAIFQERVLKDWEEGKFDDLPEVETLPDVDWAEFDEPESRPSMQGLRDIPLPPNTPRPEMWNLEGVIRAIRDGFTFGLPFVLGKSLFDPNAYWIGGQQYVASLLTVGPEHTPEAEMTPEGWLRVKLYFQPFMVPERTWTGPPNSNGVVSVYAEIDPDTVDFQALNQGHQFFSR